jgi:hypothetical protein
MGTGGECGLPDPVARAHRRPVGSLASCAQSRLARAEQSVSGADSSHALDANCAHYGGGAPAARRSRAALELSVDADRRDPPVAHICRPGR